jgi:tyrosine-protein phosphatase non-receptor type 9
MNEINSKRKSQKKSLITRSSAIKFLWARKFNIDNAKKLYEQHEETRQREGLFGFNCAVEPLRSEIQTQKFTILV